jgi:YVTN family beta-propeller protein
MKLYARQMRFLTILTVMGALAVFTEAARIFPSGLSFLRAPAGSRPTAIHRDGETVLPNGRLITPLGEQVTVAPHPYGLAISPDGKLLVSVNSGTAPFSVSAIRGLDQREPSVTQIPAGINLKDADPQSVFLGAAIAPDQRTLYLSEGNNGHIGVFDLGENRRVGTLTLDGTFAGSAYQNSLAGDLRLSTDGKRLFVLDMAHFRLVVFDTAARKQVAEVGVGRMPFALGLSPDGQLGYVTNVGTFRYHLVPGYDPKNALDTGLHFPAFGYPSPDAEQGATVEGKLIPGLGDPNVLESNSVWTVDLKNPDSPAIVARVRTGLPIGPLSVGGSSPGAVVAGKGRVFVANSAQDSVTAIDVETNQIVQTILLEPSPSVRGLRGVLPFGMALSPDEKLLYVACSGINAVAVIEAAKGSVLGYIPVGWFPARVIASPDGSRIYVANAKGFGSGPNGGPNFHEGPEGTYIGDITHGVISIIRTSQFLDRSAESISNPATATSNSASALQPLTAQVLHNNGFVPAPYAAPGGGAAAAPRPFTTPVRHVIFIVKENRTFDQVFGDLKQVGGDTVNGDAALAAYGMDARVANRKTGAVVRHAWVTPNHHALARQFAISDNFYVDSDVSVDGHHWLVGNYPNELVEAGWPAAYGGKLDYVPDDNAPGRLDIGATSPIPEAYLEAGSLWEHLSRSHISFRNFGEGMETPGADESAGLEPTGVREPENVPMTQPLFENTSRIYPNFNTNISDQYRFQQFNKEFQSLYASDKQPFPQFIFIWLPNDHTDDPRPADGYPFRASYVADNDLALGKIVQLISHSQFWKDTAIFVTEDDAQAGTDHVDAHRSVLMVISPYARHGVSHVHTSIASILKTFDLIFGMGFLNQYDAAATDLSDLLTQTPDFKPYQALPVDGRIFDPAKIREVGLENGSSGPTPLDNPAAIRKDMQRQEQEKQQQ